MQRRRAVTTSTDFLRIFKLPRREVAPPTGSAELLTDHLRLPFGKMHLWPLQAWALCELIDNSGAFCPIPVGQGKALVSLLAPTVMKAKRPLLIVPAHLRDQTNKQVIPEMREHWELNPNLRVIGYSELSLMKNKTLMQDLNPDLLILDEVHYLKSKKSARTKRVSTYMKERPDTVVLALSGTVSSRSICDYAHILEWTHGKYNTPLPMSWTELNEWALALDEKVIDGNRLAPGVLNRFQRGTETVREGYGRRLTETPGVVSGRGTDINAALYIKPSKCRTPQKARIHLINLRNNWEDPNGGAMAEAVDIWRCARQLALGFWYEWEPKAPRYWLDAKRAWKGYVREQLKHNRRGLDSELQVFMECLRAQKQSFEFDEWARVKDDFKINTVPQWLTMEVVEFCAEWLERTKGIVWVEHVAFGEKLSEVTGLPYFGAGDKASRDILTVKGPIIAGIRSYGTGRNLQDRWHRNLVTSGPSSGKAWEQLLGRTHRHGQEADEVMFEVMLSTPEQRNGFDQAVEDAKYLEDTLRNRQKLNYATIERAI